MKNIAELNQKEVSVFLAQVLQPKDTVKVVVSCEISTGNFDILQVTTSIMGIEIL